MAVEFPADLRRVPEDRLQAAGGAADWGVEACLGPAFRGIPRPMTPRETLRALRHALRLLPPVGAEEMAGRPHEVACRLLAENSLLFGEAMPLLVEWDQRQPEPVGAAKLEVQLIDAMNAAWEGVPGLKHAARTDEADG